MANTSFHTTFSTIQFLHLRAKNGSESGLRSTVSYRFGFNGQEMDNEITGQTGTHTTAMFWEYDARLGRRWNVDPVLKQWESPYLCFSGNPIWFSDPAGDNAVNPDGYTVDDDGNVERVDDTGGDDYDVLYKKSDYWIAQQKTRQTGETNEYGNPEPEKQLKVYDTSILPSLEKTDTKFRQEDYWNTTIVNNKYNPNTKEWTKTYEVPMLQGHYCITKNSYEAKKVFDFLASNSKVEWASKGSVNGKWFIGTLHVDGQAPDAKLLTGYTKENTPVFTVMVDFGVMQIFYDAHSHPLNSEEIDFKPSPTDIYRKNRLREENPNIQFWLFMPQNPKTKWINYGNY